MSAPTYLDAYLHYAGWHGILSIAPDDQPAFQQWLRGEGRDYWEHERTLYYRAALERVQISKPPTIVQAYQDAVEKGHQDPNDATARAQFIAQWNAQHGEAAP